MSDKKKTYAEIATNANPKAAKVNGKPPASAKEIPESPPNYEKYKACCAEAARTKKRTEKIEMERKEAYLSDADFERVFGMGKDAFGALAAWKRKDVKKKVGLF